MPVDAIILAGAPAGADMSPEDETISRAMVKIGPKTMLQWIVDALRSSQSIERIIAVGDVSADGLGEVVKPSQSFLDNLMLGVDACGHNEPVLVLSSDIPMLTGEAVDDFIARALASGGEMCYPVITKESCIDKYPGMKRTYLKTREGTFTGGNMLLLSPAFMRRNEERISDAYAARKKVFTLARMIGFGVLIRAVLAQILFPSVLQIPMLERAVSKMLGGRVAVIPTNYPEIGEDVDKESDLEAVRIILAS